MKAIIIEADADLLELWREGNGYTQTKSIVHVTDALQLSDALKDSQDVFVLEGAYRRFKKSVLLGIVGLIARKGIILEILPRTTFTAPLSRKFKKLVRKDDT